MEGNEAQVRLVFAGEVLDGFLLDDVKRRFGEAFKVDGERLNEMFSGERTVLKRSIGRDDGERYVLKLRKMGMRVRAEALDDAAGPATPPKPTLTSAPAAATPSLLPLEEEVTCPNCGERQPKRVICRKCQSDIPRAQAAKQEELDKARAERLAAREGREGGRFAPPTADLGNDAYEATDEPPPLLGRSFSGRMGRLTYFNAYMATMGVVALIGILAAVILPFYAKGGGGAVLFFLVPLLLVVPAGVFWGLRAAVLRLHDLNLSGWWVLATLIPYAGAVLSLAMMFWPGTSGENDHGEQPRRGNGVVAIVILLVIVIGAIASLSSYRSYVRRAKAQASENSTQTQIDPAAVQKANQYLVSPAAQRAFVDEYLAQPDPKAFSASDSGAWGWRVSQVSVQEAARQSLQACEEKRKPYTTACKVVNVNGLWLQEQAQR